MGEGEKTVKIMKKIAKMNGKEVSIEEKNGKTQPLLLSSHMDILIFFF